MKIGVPREVKADEYRVSLTPSGARSLINAGHEVLVEKGAGAGAFFPDEDYARAGATVVDGPEAAWGDADLVLKVKEPIAQEYGFLRRGLQLFTYLHMAADRPLTDAMLSSGVDSIAYENVTERDGSLPLLAPMSEIAGRLGSIVGANTLLKHNGGRGMLLGGVPGTEKCKVVVLGGGVAGKNAADMAIGMGADVTVLDVSIPTLRRYDDMWGGRVQTLVSTPEVVEDQVADAQLVIGAVLLPGARTPRLVSTAMIEQMQPGAVLVDIAVDQGGCFEPTRPTTHHDPTFQVGDALLYCVANMPGAVPRTSTLALTNATLPFALEIAQHGMREAARRDPRLADGYCTSEGRLFLSGVAGAWGLEQTPVSELLG